jgi:hypothetical protein
MNYDVLKFEVLKTDDERLRLLAIQEEWYVIFDGEYEGKAFEEYHKVSQEVAFNNAVDYWKNIPAENIWNEVVSNWGEDYVIDVWVNDRQSTETLQNRIDELKTTCAS